MKSSIALIANPKAGGHSDRRLREAIALIKEKGFDLSVRLTDRAGGARGLTSPMGGLTSPMGGLTSPAEGLAREALAESPSLIIACGGDGTINEVINAIAGGSVPLAILPLGTTNVLARELGIPADMRGAVETALYGRTHSVTLGRIKYAGGVRHFVMMAGIGFDALSVKNASVPLKRFIGNAAYAISGLMSLASWRPDKLSVVADGKSLSGYSLIVSNVSRYAGDLGVTPGARIEEPSLYLFLMKGRKRFDILRYAASIAAGRQLKLRDIEYMPLISLSVKGRAAIQVDGDYIGESPCEIEAVPGALKIVY